MNLKTSYKISIPTTNGFVGRRCSNQECRKYFQIHETSINPELICPYCGQKGPIDAMMTEQQKNYALNVVAEEAMSQIQQLSRQNIDVKGFKVQGQDKRARLASVSSLVKFGQVLFPKCGAEELIQQLLYFGVEKHDDLVDAFSMLLLIALQRDTIEPSVPSPEMCALIRGGGSYISSNSNYGNQYSQGGYYF